MAKGRQKERSEDDSKTVQVMTRFERSELDIMKEETGATADATAVSCFVRKNLRKKAG